MVLWELRTKLSIHFRTWKLVVALIHFLFDPATIREIVQNVLSELFMRECSATRYPVRGVAWYYLVFKVTVVNV